MGSLDHVDPLSIPRLDSTVSLVLQSSTMRAFQLCSSSLPAEMRPPRREVSCISPLRHPSAFPFPRPAARRCHRRACRPQLARLGHKVTVYLPRYRQTKLDNPQKVIPSITVPFDDRYRFCSVLDGGVRAGVQFYFIDYPPYFDRDALYGTPLGDYHDNAERFALFCRAVLESTKILGVARRVFTATTGRLPSFRSC